MMVAIAWLVLGAAAGGEVAVVRVAWPGGEPAAWSDGIGDRATERTRVQFALRGVVRSPVGREEVAGMRAGSEDEARWLEAIWPQDVGDRAVVFVFSGGVGRYGCALWPHQGEVRSGGSTRRFVVLPEDDGSGWTAGVLVHEIGHLLGLREHAGGMSGADCPMAGGYAPGDAVAADPPEYCGLCRARLGWLDAGEWRRLPLEEELADGAAARVRIGLAQELVIERRGSTMRMWVARGSWAMAAGGLADGGRVELPGAVVARTGARVRVELPRVRGRLLDPAAPLGRRGVLIGNR
jgi:hypothetical protein